MTLRLVSRIFILTLLTLLTLGQGSAQALEVRGMRFGVHPDKTRLVVDLDRTTPFRAFMLSDPVRLVIDTPRFTWRVGDIGKPRNSDIRDIRQGANGPDVSRIVIDLGRTSLISSAFMIPRASGQPDRIVIDYAPVSVNDFTHGKSKIFGSLETAPPVAAQKEDQNTPIPQPKPAIANANPLPKAERPLIVIDAGHGGEDPGAIGANGLKEKNITLAMAKDLKAQLEATNRYRVHLTRDKDFFIRLSGRVAIARNKGADLFISLHADSINRSGVRGASIYTLSEKASDAETEKLAARENHADLIAGIDLSHEDEDVANILVDLAMRDTMNQSKFFANKVVAVLKNGGVRILDNPHRYAGFAVLKAPDIPSVLIELGYMSNSQESAMLSKPEYRGQIARALVSGIDGYFEAVRKNR